LQGVGIFLLTTLRRADMRKAWLDPIRRRLRGNNDEVKSSSKASEVASARTSKAVGSSRTGELQEEL